MTIYTIIESENKFYSCHSNIQSHHTNYAPIKSGKPINLYILTNLPKPLFCEIATNLGSKRFINVIEIIKTCTKIPIIYSVDSDDPHIDSQIEIRQVHHYSEPKCIDIHNNIEEDFTKYVSIKKQFDYKRLH